MQISGDGSFHLTYCTNIHPGDGWQEVFGNLCRYAPALKERLSPGRPFGIGLRLSSLESEELLAGNRLARFRGWLDDHGLYVALLNGFPYGCFHRQRVKERVFAPDWRQEERVQYSLRLIRILSQLVPGGVDGGISTNPLSYKGWVSPDDRQAWERITRNVVRVAEAMARVKRETGKTLHLDIEPEPDGLIENTAETVGFYDRWLLPVGGPALADVLAVSEEEARGLLLDHVQICYDTCHLAVEYERPGEMLAQFRQAGIQVGRIQISSALRVRLPKDPDCRAGLARQLEPFAESTYLHQVIERRSDGSFRRYPDLPDALPRIQESVACEWRIHFHVPIFVEEYGGFGSTQSDIREALAIQVRSPYTRHLEIETYTWEVLPPPLKEELLESIHREYRWVLASTGGREATGYQEPTGRRLR